MLHGASKPVSSLSTQMMISGLGLRLEVLDDPFEIPLLGAEFLHHPLPELLDLRHVLFVDRLVASRVSGGEMITRVETFRSG